MPETSRLTEILADLAAEGEQLDAWIADLPSATWTTPTPSHGWTIAHQIAHLTWTDDVAISAVTDPTAFGAVLKQAAADPDGFVGAGAEPLVLLAPVELLGAWRAGRPRLVDALRGLPPGERVPWFGPPMSPASMTTARLMETWAHGHDIAEALSIGVPRSSRVRHVCHLGVRTRSFAYAVRGLEPPSSDVYVSLAGPAGERWTWGDADAADRITGSAWDFALLATRRRHRDDVDVQAEGAAADDWLSIIQAFAGPPGRDPERSSR